MKKINLGILLEFLLIIVSLFICLLNNLPNGYSYLFLMPLTFLLSKFIYSLISQGEENIFADYCIEFLSLIKYVIMPIIIVLTKDFYNGVLTGQVPLTKDVKTAIVLLCIECISIFFARFLFKKIINKKKITIKNSVDENNLLGPIIIILLVITLPLIVKYFDSFLPSNFFGNNAIENTTKIDSSVDGLIKILFYLFKIFIMLFGIQFFRDKYKQKKNKIWILLIFILIFSYAAINLSTSRWNLVLPIIILIYMNRDILLSTRGSKVFVSIPLLIISTLFINISNYKFDWLTSKTDKSFFSTTSILLKQTQEYFSGPRATAQGIETLNYYGNQITFKTFINDFTGSIPFISHFVNQNDRINIYYNYLLKGTRKEATQIMPMVTIGMTYFTIALCWIPTVAFILLSYYFCKLYLKSNNFFEKYINLYASIWCALCIGFNTQIIYGWFLSSYIPFIIVSYLNKKTYLKRNNII